MPLLYHILYAIQPFYSHFSGSFHTKNREKRRNFLNSHTGGLQAQKLSCRTVTAAPTLRRGRHGMPRSPPFLPLLPYAESRSAAPDLPSAAPYPAVRSLFGRHPFDRRINRTVHWRFLSLFACADLAEIPTGAAVKKPPPENRRRKKPSFMCFIYFTRTRMAFTLIACTVYPNVLPLVNAPMVYGSNGVTYSLSNSFTSS